jgi:lipid A 3-O-deacylase
MAGYYSNCTIFDDARPVYNFTPVSLRWGKICDFPWWDDCDHTGGGLLRGSFEPIFEVNGAAAVEGFGHSFAGTALILRYNFVQPGFRIIPYVQLGAGVQYNDAYRDTTQTALGQALTYSLSAQAGVRYFIKPNLSLDIEGGYIHLSNLNQSARNDGIDALGGTIGITYYFGNRCRH